MNKNSVLSAKQSQFFSHRRFIMALCLSLTCGCSHSSQMSATSKPNADSQRLSSPFTYESNIELEYGEKAEFSDYCKTTGGKAVTTYPSSVDTSKDGESTVTVTISDEEGNMELANFTVKVTKVEKVTEEKKEEDKKEETKAEDKKEDTTTSNSSNPSSSSNSGNNQTVTQAPVQQPSAPAVTQPSQPAAAPPQQPVQTTPQPDVEEEGPVAGTQGDPAGSTYDTQAGCNAGAGLASHTCTWDPLLKKYVLTY